MCKLAIFPYIPAEVQSEVLALANRLVRPMTLNDKDGFGFALTSEKGLYTRRFLLPGIFSEVGPNRVGTSPLNLLLEPSEDSSGIYGAPNSLMLHSRMATCGKTLENAHPHVSRDGLTALIHNGIITNVAELTKDRNPKSTCDSEGILLEYLNRDVSTSPDALLGVVEDLDGWHACGVLTKPKNSDAWLMDIWRDDTTPLYSLQVIFKGYNLPVMLFLTDPSHFEKAAIGLDISLAETPRKLLPWSHFRFNTLTGELVYSQAIPVDPFSEYSNIGSEASSSWGALTGKLTSFDPEERGSYEQDPFYYSDHEYSYSDKHWGKKKKKGRY